MALRVNLYHEVQRQQAQRRRDPLKLGFYAMGLIALGFVLYYFVRLGSVHETTARLGTMRAEWMKLEPKANLAKTQEDELTAQVKTADTLVKRIEGRTYWAPVIEGIVRAVPREVQLMKLKGELSIEPGKLNVISLTGISSSAVPRKVAEDLRITVENQLTEKFKHVTSSFKSLEDSDDALVLNGARAPVANFSLDFLLNPVSAPEPAAASAAVHKRKS